MRIIAGSLGGRVLEFNVVEGLRPSGDRIRETLFNWLQPNLPGALCLDMYAGSGALGFEALSRGAMQVDMIEKSALAAADLQRNAEQLKASRAVVRHADVTRCEWPARQYDIVFIDPPFAGLLHDQSIVLLQRHALLHADSLVYLEWPARQAPPELPSAWRMERRQSAGEVCFALCRTTDIAAA